MKRWYVLAAALLLMGIMTAKPVTGWATRTAFGLEKGDKLDEEPAQCAVCSASTGAEPLESYRLEQRIDSPHGTFRVDDPLCGLHLNPTQTEIRQVMAQRQKEIDEIENPARPFYKGRVVAALKILPPLSAKHAGEQAIALR